MTPIPSALVSGTATCPTSDDGTVGSSMMSEHAASIVPIAIMMNNLFMIGIWKWLGNWRRVMSVLMDCFRVSLSFANIAFIFVKNNKIVCIHRRGADMVPNPTISWGWGNEWRKRFGKPLLWHLPWRQQPNTLDDTTSLVLPLLFRHSPGGLSSVAAFGGRELRIYCCREIRSDFFGEGEQEWGFQTYIKRLFKNET